MNSRARVVSAIVAATAAASLALFAGGGANAGGRPFNLQLSGANEFGPTGVPINPHGDADHAPIALTLNPGQGEVCWTIGELTLTAGDSLPVVAHIHEAPAGISGPIVVDLFGMPDTPAAPTSYPTDTNCVDAPRSVILEIMQDPSEYYVNLHSAEHPAGVMRAQLG